MRTDDFVKCLTTGSWMLRGHQYKFLSPAGVNSGYFTVDGISNHELNFEVTFEDGSMYLYLNVDREEMPEERYKILSNYCATSIMMYHELRNEQKSGYGDATEVIFEKAVQPVTPTSRSWTFKLAGQLHKLWRRTSELAFKEA